MNPGSPSPACGRAGPPRSRNPRAPGLGTSGLIPEIVSRLHLSFNMSVHLSSYLSLHLSFYLSLYCLSTCLFICLSTCRFTSLSTCRCICLCTCLSTCLSTVAGFGTKVIRSTAKQDFLTIYPFLIHPRTRECCRTVSTLQPWSARCISKVQTCQVGLKNGQRRQNGEAG